MKTLSKMFKNLQVLSEGLAAVAVPLSASFVAVELQKLGKQLLKHDNATTSKALSLSLD